MQHARVVSCQRGAAPVAGAALPLQAPRRPPRHHRHTSAAAGALLGPLHTLGTQLLRPSDAACQLHSWMQGGTQQQICLRPRRCRVHASGASSSSSGGGSSTILTLPTLLTLGRVAAVPALVAAWYSTAPWAAAACTALFVGAALTDYLDGYLARKMNASSAFGAFLDPVADKLMVATVMILLCTAPIPLGPLAGNTWLLPMITCVVIGREITMSALREWAAALGPEARSAVAVSWVGKWKTATQMASLTLLLLAHQGVAAAAGAGSGGGTVGALPPAVLQAAGAGSVPLLVAAAVLTVYSLVQYFAGLWRFF